MSRAPVAADAPERVHPRDDFAPLDGMEAPAAAFEAALARGRLHHAWLLVGPEGVGKARFAVRAARRLLGAPPDPAAGPLGSDPGAAAARLLAARAHPDFLMLEREVPDGGKPRRNIPVDEARRLPEFFSQTPAVAAWRVAIIDSADDLNANAANAVLKTLEEPPPRGVLLLVSHAPGRLLDTIRSRCRTLRFAPWTEAALAARLARVHGLESDEAARLAALARGSPGRAEALARAAAGPDLREEADALLDALARPDQARLQKLAEGFRGGEGAERFAALLAALADAAQARAQAAAAEGGGAAADAWAQAWSRLARAPGEAEALNLDRADAFWGALASLRAAHRAAA